MTQDQDTIRVTRFVSAPEYNAYRAGEILTNNTVHAANDKSSTAVGFVFTEMEPQRAWRFLRGIVDADYCLALDFPRGYLHEAQARYIDYDRQFTDKYHPPTKMLTEWCAKSYSNKTAKLVKVLEPAEFMEPIELAYYPMIRKNLKHIPEND